MNLNQKTYNSQLYYPPYSLKVKLRNCNDKNEIFVETDQVSTMIELPQNISELVNKYDLIKKFINSHEDNIYLQFDIKFFCGLGYLDQVYCIQIGKLKNIIV